MKKNKPKSAFILIAGLCLSMLGQAQSIVTHSVNSAGASFAQPSQSLAFTVGELIISSLTDNNGNTLENGFIPSAVNSTTVVSVKEPHTDILDISVYPNPTTNMIFVDVASSQLGFVHIDIVDINGRLLASYKYTTLINNHIGINLSNFITGTYYLIIKDEIGNKLGNYKLVKQ